MRFQAICRLLAARTRTLYGMVEDATLALDRRPGGAAAAFAGARRCDAGQDARPVVPVSQEALAMMLGITRQTLSKELKALAARGAISLGYRRIEIVSLDKLGSAG